MAAFSDALENALLNYIFGATTYTPPATWYIALFTASPSDAGGGTEVTGGGYARKAVTNNTSNFPTTTTSEKNLASEATFDAATANWGTIVAVGLFTTSTGGTLQAWCSIPSQVVVTGDNFKIPAGTAGLSVTLE